MATKKEIYEVMLYIAADRNFDVTNQKLQVWTDQFSQTPLPMLQKAARLMLSRKVFGTAPSASDLWDAIKELSKPEGESWVTAWDTFVKLARKAGSYRKAELSAALKERFPAIHKAIGTTLSDYFELTNDRVETFKAQFERRYRELETREASEKFRAPGTSSKALVAGERLRLDELVRDASKTLSIDVRRENGGEQ